MKPSVLLSIALLISGIASSFADPPWGPMKYNAYTTNNTGAVDARVQALAASGIAPAGVVTNHQSGVVLSGGFIGSLTGTASVASAVSGSVSNWTQTSATNAARAMVGSLLNVVNYGAKGDLVATAGSIESNSVTLACARTFTSADIGKWVAVFRAGLTNSDLLASVTNVSGGSALIDRVAEGSVTNAYVKVFTDNRAAFQAAIDAAAALGGATITVPQGSYGMFPSNYFTATTAGPGYASYPTLLISSGNVTLKGDGAMLDFIGMFRRAPAQVLRASGIWVLGAITNVGFEGITFYGGLTNGFTANQDVIAETSLGDGWDVTHKGVLIGTEPYAASDNVWFNRCTVKGWRGEAIYPVNENGHKLSFDDCVFTDNNASCINPANELHVRRCKFLNSNMASETSQWTSNPGSEWVDCCVSNCISGIIMTGYRSGVNAPVLIRGCSFIDIQDHATATGNAKGLMIKDCTFIRCGTAFGAMQAGIGGDALGIDMDFVSNTIYTNTYGIKAAGAFSRFNCADNTFLGCDFEVYYYGNFTNVVFTRNTFNGGTANMGFVMAAGVTGTLPLIIDNIYRPTPAYVSQFIWRIGSDPTGLYSDYLGEYGYPQPSSVIRREVSVNTNGIPDGAIIHIRGYDTTIPAYVYTFSNLSNTIVVPKLRTLRMIGDQETIRYTVQDGRWHEVSYTAGSWASAAQAPTTGLWVEGEEITSTSATNTTYLCTVGGSPGTWITNNHALIGVTSNEVATMMSTDGFNVFYSDSNYTITSSNVYAIRYAWTNGASLVTNIQDHWAVSITNGIIKTCTNGIWTTLGTLSADVPLLSAYNAFSNANQFLSSVEFDGTLTATNAAYFGGRVRVGSTGGGSETNQFEVVASGGDVRVGTNGVLYTPQGVTAYGFSIPQLPWIPTNSIPASSSGITNYVLCNLSNTVAGTVGGPCYVATNYSAAGSFIILKPTMTQTTWP